MLITKDSMRCKTAVTGNSNGKKTYEQWDTIQRCETTRIQVVQKTMSGRIDI